MFLKNKSFFSFEKGTSFHETDLVKTQFVQGCMQDDELIRLLKCEVDLSGEDLVKNFNKIEL